MYPWLSAYAAALADPYKTSCWLLPPSSYNDTQTTTDWLPVPLRTRHQVQTPEGRQAFHPKHFHCQEGTGGSQLIRIHLIRIHGSFNVKNLMCYISRLNGHSRELK